MMTASSAVAATHSNDAALAWLRREVPATLECAYLNTGASGPLLSVAGRAMVEATEEELRLGRASPARFAELPSKLAAVRRGMAHLVGATEEELALTESTTNGINIVLWGLPWRQGDRVVSTTLEHPGVLVPLRQLGRRSGVKVHLADIGSGSRAEALDALKTALDQPCRLLVLSQVTYSTGASLPMPEIVELAHAAGTRVLVDGAQAVGAIPVDCHALGADFYAFPGQKWLCGPEGTGGLFVRAGLLDELEPTFVGFGSVDHGRAGPAGEHRLSFAGDAARYHMGLVDPQALAGLAATAVWHREHAEAHKIFERIAQLTRYCRREASRMAGAEVLTPEDGHAGLVVLRHRRVDALACAKAMDEEGIVVRSIPYSGALRISCGFFNTFDEIDRTLARIAEWAAPGAHASVTT